MTHDQPPLCPAHREALELARHLTTTTTWTPADAADVTARFAASAELEAHFQDEEANVVPDLQAHGAAELATRVLAEHAQMRALAARAEDHTAARALGELLAAHVEFEEASVFPTCERAEEEEDE